MRKRTLLLLVFAAVLLYAGIQLCQDGTERVEGAKWQAEDGSLLVLNDDGTFIWYQDGGNRDDDYYTGSYQIYFGKKAINYIAEELSQYGLDKEAQEEMIGHGKARAKTKYLCLVLDQKEYILNGRNTLKQSETRPFYGFLTKDDTYFDLIDMTEMVYRSFNRMPKK